MHELPNTLKPGWKTWRFDKIAINVNDGLMTHQNQVSNITSGWNTLNRIR
jgi:hypothetical protein